MLLRSAKFTQQCQSKPQSDFQKQYRSCQEKLKDHLSKKRSAFAVKSCSNHQFRESEEKELNVILDPILNISKPRKVCKFIDRGSGKKGVVCKLGKLVGESFKKSIRRFKVEGFVCVPSLYKYDKEDPKLVRTRSDSCVHYKEYTSFGPGGGCFRDQKKPKTEPKISKDHRYGIHGTDVSNPDKISSERLPPTAPYCRISNDIYQKPKNIRKPSRNLQTSSSGSTDDMVNASRPIRDTPESERTKIQPLTNKAMELKAKRYSNLVESIKQTIAAIRERDLHSRTNATRELNRVRIGEGEPGLKMLQQGLLKMRNDPDDEKTGENGGRNRNLEPFEYGQTKVIKQTADRLPKMGETSTCLTLIKTSESNQALGISDTSSGSYKTASSVKSQTNQSNLSESTDMVECEAPKKLTGGRISEGKNRCDKVSDGKKPGKIDRNPDRTPLRVMNYSFEGHVTFPAKSNVREKSKSRVSPPVSSKLSIGIGRAEGVKEDGQYGSNFALKASKSHFDLTTSLRGGKRQHGRRK